MKNKVLGIAVMAACLTSGASAFAQATHGDRYDRPGGGYQPEARGERYDRPGGGYQPEARGERYDRAGGGYQPEGRGERYDRPGGGYQPEHRRHRRGAGPEGDIFQGKRLPAAFWGKQYVVRDWQRRRLSPPLRGHYWVRTGNDYVMSSVSTGIVAKVTLR